MGLGRQNNIDQFGWDILGTSGSEKTIRRGTKEMELLEPENGWFLSAEWDVLFYLHNDEFETDLSQFREKHL